MTEGGFKLGHFYDTAKSASRRVRWVLIMVVVASILASVAAFNTRKNDWTTLRMNWAAKELKKIKKLDMTPQSEVDILYLTNLLHMYQSKWVDNCYIRLPFFGVVLDVNDLGAASGLGFLIILIMFRYSRRTELNTFHAVFSKARDEDQLKEYYTLLLETQVLTIPKFGPNVQRKFWRWLPKSFYFLPMIVQLYVVINDFFTIQESLKESPTSVIIITGISIITLVLICILTVNTFKISIRFNKLWNGIYTELMKNKGG